MKAIDDFLNNITMYRLVLYYLIVLVVVAAIFSVFGILPFTFGSLVVSVFVLLAVSLIVNISFSNIFNVTTNIESVYISALILALIITPMTSISDLGFYMWVGFLAMASKYLVTINKKHLFNPVALAVFLTSIGIGQGAVWWVGTTPMFIFVLLGGLLIVRKLRRFDLVFYFLFTALTMTLGITAFNGGDLLPQLQKLLLGTPLLFFAFVMLTEPMTMPPTKKLQSIYGAIVGFLLVPQIHFGSFYPAPETALLIGNIYSYLVSSKERLVLTLKEKIKIAENTYEYIFNLNEKFSYVPGQYMEWTLGHSNPDTRGNRRYFTLASSPTENNLRLGIKFYENSSSFKKKLLTIGEGTQITASQLTGDFVLPEDRSKKVAFIAGGIGITPFRSMTKYLLDTHQKRNITLFYVNKTVEDIAYKDIFDEAWRLLGMKTVYVLTDKTRVPLYWKGETGRLDEQIIRDNIPDYRDRAFYLSGPHALVTSYEEILSKMGIKEKNIIKDYFPGFA